MLPLSDAVAYAGPSYTPLPAHPAPRAGNVSREAVSLSEPTFWPLAPETTLILIYTNGVVRVIADEDASVIENGFTLRAGYHSFAVTPGTTLSFQGYGSAATVEVLEG